MTESTPENPIISIDTNKINFTSNFFFYLGLCLLFVHEMDAIRLQEWKMFLFLSQMQEENAYLIFTAIHIPLYVLLFWGLSINQTNGINRRLIIALDIFFIVHLFLHILFLNHINNQFKSLFSWGLITGIGISGAINLFQNIKIKSQMHVGCVNDSVRHRS
jgi:hypothetical protein